MSDLLSDLKITRTANPKPKPDAGALGFGEIFTDHMFLLDYDEGKGWHSPRIVPYAPLSLDPAAAVLHYAQEMFEGLKTYLAEDGSARLFRPDMNAARARATCERICIPPIDENLFVEAVKALVREDKDWIPNLPGTSLYIRPFVVATEPFLGVRPALSYKFIIILSPVALYYKEGLAPTKIFVEDEYVRAAKGGTGFAKIGGNYAMGLKSQVKAHDKGCSQVLWLDGVERKYVEEIGTSNAFFVMNGEVFTAPLEGTILPGITRNCVLTLLRDKGIPVREERFTIEEVFAAADKGELSEVFASGTAAIISPVGEMVWKDRTVVINEGKIGEVSQALYDNITGIQTGKLPDKYGWTVGL